MAGRASRLGTYKSILRLGTFDAWRRTRENAQRLHSTTTTTITTGVLLSCCSSLCKSRWSPGTPRRRREVLYGVETSYRIHHSKWSSTVRQIGHGNPSASPCPELPSQPYDDCNTPCNAETAAGLRISPALRDRSTGREIGFKFSLGGLARYLSVPVGECDLFWRRGGGRMACESLRGTGPRLLFKIFSVT